jgi:hypothetical protein
MTSVFLSVCKAIKEEYSKQKVMTLNEAKRFARLKESVRTLIPFINSINEEKVDFESLIGSQVPTRLPSVTPSLISN